MDSKLARLKAPRVWKRAKRFHYLLRVLVSSVSCWIEDGTDSQHAIAALALSLKKPHSWITKSGTGLTVANSAGKATPKGHPKRAKFISRASPFVAVSLQFTPLRLKQVVALSRSRMHVWCISSFPNRKTILRDGWPHWKFWHKDAQKCRGKVIHW